MTTQTAESGVVILDKPEGPTSHDVVARLRRVLGTRRVGHAGTLDPMATGVLVVAFGRGTRLLPYLQATRKQYLATVRLGLATSTDDRTGTPLALPVAVGLGDADIDRGLQRFVGDILQRPSAVSAIKVDGRRAHALVRAGEQVSPPSRPVRIDSLTRLGPARPGPQGCLDVEIEVTCSTGTYVRALARDLGDVLGCGGHLTMLRRTAVGPFDVAHACPLPDRDTDPSALRLLTLTEAAAAALPVVVLDAQQAARAAKGQKVPCEAERAPSSWALLDTDGALVAIAEPAAGMWSYRAVFR
jgi:tRNA pseudouridine55 synthase